MTEIYDVLSLLGVIISAFALGYMIALNTKD